MNPRLDCTFPKSLRLRKRYHYQQMHQAGTQKFVGHLIIVEMRVNKALSCRLGITVTKRFGDAHERNRFKRIVKEAFRLSLSSFCHSFDLVVKPREAVKGASTQAIQKELVRSIQWAVRQKSSTCVETAVSVH